MQLRHNFIAKQLPDAGDVDVLAASMLVSDGLRTIVGLLITAISKMSKSD